MGARRTPPRVRNPLPINKQTLRDAGFAGFRPLARLEINRVPQAPGIFAVLKPDGYEPRFLAKSTAGVFKKKDPSLGEAALAAEWIDDADVLYLGKAGPGSKGNRGLRQANTGVRRLREGQAAGPLGRPIDLAARRSAVPGDRLERAAGSRGELGGSQLPRRFPSSSIGRLPFANLVQARAKGA